MEKEKIEDKIILYDEIINTSLTNLLSFSNRKNRKNFFIPYRDREKRILSLYDIEIAKIASIISEYNTITMEVHNLNDFIFLLKMKWNLRKHQCNIKKAKKEDINDDIRIFTLFMKRKMNITDDTFIEVYNNYLGS